MDSIRDIRIEERRLEAAWKRDPDYGTLRGRYREEIYGRYAPSFDADQWALLDDPYGVLTIPKRWPHRLSLAVAYESVRAWTAQAFGPFADEWPFAQWSADGPAYGRMLWPLPIGKQAFQSAITRCAPISPAPVAAMMPFEEDEHVFLILRIPIRTSHVTMFGLTQPVNTDAGTFRLSGCRFLLSSATPYDLKTGSDGARMKAVIGHARRFWGKFQGVEHRGSMNAGAPTLSIAVHEDRRQKVAEWTAYKVKYSLTWKQVAINKNVPYGRLQKWRRDFGEK